MKFTTLKRAPSPGSLVRLEVYDDGLFTDVMGVVVIVACYDFGGEYYLSDDISKPGAKPYFFVSVKQNTRNPQKFVTDGKIFFSAEHHSWPDKDMPSVNGDVWKLVRPQQTSMTADCRHEMLEAIKRYSDNTK